ncbi:FAD binding domain-containing protein [Mycolicibacterium sp. J2]|uniref:FAD binding domain-containing protein n=1 Tax=Mycolicibacterium sp. J2 TaxID=2993511 RepID=UPI00224B8517|nr:FAD binding domain-containing protein [Mycolicibacterium sp. J2]MCX2711076.1 FAD binding domain-containing protein [Mycolicibacterium sp. J2]
MDLNDVEVIDAPRHRDELWPLGPGDAVLAGGTWLFSEPQPHLTRLVDLAGLGWPSVTRTADGVELAATCTIAEVSRLSEELGVPLLHQCCAALLASFKIWHTATVGGNLCLAFPAGAMISMVSALAGTVTVWRPDGTEYRCPIDEFVTGESTTVLAPGDIVRSVFLPARTLAARTAFRKLAPAPLGRSAVVVIGRRDTDGRFGLSVTAATVRPYTFTFAAVPDPDEVAAAHAQIPDSAWTDDAHGDPDWRRAMTLVLARQVAAELA